MSIRENSTVKVIGGMYDGKTGKVVNVYPTLDVAIVSFDDNGDVGKILLSALVEVRPQENRETKSEIPEGAKKISRADFEEALKRVTSPDHVFGNKSRNSTGDFMRCITTMLVGKEVTEKIFKDQDVVVMTENEFISAIWSACDPVSVSENVNKKMSSRKCITVAMTAIISFEEIVAIIFGEERV